MFHELIFHALNFMGIRMIDFFMPKWNQMQVLGFKQLQIRNQFQRWIHNAVWIIWPWMYWSTALWCPWVTKHLIFTHQSRDLLQRLSFLKETFVSYTSQKRQNNCLFFYRSRLCFSRNDFSIIKLFWWTCSAWIHGLNDSTACFIV